MGTKESAQKVGCFYLHSNSVLDIISTMMIKLAVVLYNIMIIYEHIHYVLLNMDMLAAVVPSRLYR